MFVSVTFVYPDGLRVTGRVPRDYSVLQAAQLLEIQQISGDCGGTMACATCHVVMDQDGLERLARTDNLQSEEEKDILELAPQHSVMSRLSCQIRLTPALDGLVIYVPNKSYEN